MSALRGDQPKIESVKDLLRALEFAPLEGETGQWARSFSAHDGYLIKVDMAHPSLVGCAIDYGPGISVGRTTTCNFGQPESAVVLECVTRLLELGYKPNSIVLEKRYAIARSDAFLDILVLKEGAPFLMVECKTFGREHKLEYEKMLLDGG